MLSKDSVSKSDLMFFQNDILSDIKRLEQSFNNKITALSQTFDQKITDNESKYNKLSDSINELVSIYATRKHDNEKIEQLLDMRSKLSEQIQDCKNQITFLSRNFDNAVFKYDRIVSDNLEVPGIVGSAIGAKFRNLKLFIEFIFGELKNFKLFKDQQILNTKVYKEKLENLIKKIEIGLKEVSEKATNICSQKFTEYEKIMDDRCKITEEIVLQQKIENSKYALDLINKTKELQIQWDKIEKIKDEIDEMFHNELKKFKAEVENNTRIFTLNQNDFKVLKQRFTQLCEFIKDVRFQKNLTTKNGEFRKMAKKIDFTQKQKLKNDYDTNNVYDQIGNNVVDYLNQGLKEQEKNNNIMSIEKKRRASVIIRNTVRTKFENDNMNVPLIDSSPRKRVNKRNSMGFINVGDISKFKNLPTKENENNNNASQSQTKLIAIKNKKKISNVTHNNVVKLNKEESFSSSSSSSSSIGSISVSSSINKSSININNKKSNDNNKKSKSKINETTKNDKEEKKEKEIPKIEKINTNTIEFTSKKDDTTSNKQPQKKEDYASKVKLTTLDYMNRPIKRQSYNSVLHKTQTNFNTNIINNFNNKFLQSNAKHNNTNKTELRRNLIGKNNSSGKFPHINPENSNNGFHRISNNNKNLMLNVDSNTIKSPTMKNQDNIPRITNIRNNSFDYLGSPNSYPHNILNFDNSTKNFYHTQDKILKNTSITYISQLKMNHKNYVIQKSQNLYIPPNIINIPPYKENIFNINNRYKSDIRQYFMGHGEDKEMEMLGEVLEKEHYIAGLFYVTNKIKKINENNENMANKIKLMEENYLPIFEQIKEIFKIMTNIYEVLKKDEHTNKNSNSVNSNINVVNNNNLSNFNNINSSLSMHATSNLSKIELNNNSKYDLSIKGNGIMKDYKTKKGGINLTFPSKKEFIKNVYLGNTSKNFGKKDTFNIVNINNNLMNNFNNINTNISSNSNRTNNLNTASSCNIPNDTWNLLIRKIEPFLVKQFTKEPTE